MDPAVLSYFDAVPERRAQKLRKLHALVVGRFPRVLVDMHYKMPTYRLDDGWVAIANQKNHVSLYTCGAEHLAAFKSGHPEIRTGKGCINFRDRDEIPEGAILAVIEHAMLYPKPHKGS